VPRAVSAAVPKNVTIGARATAAADSLEVPARFPENVDFATAKQSSSVAKSNFAESAGGSRTSAPKSTGKQWTSLQPQQKSAPSWTSLNSAGQSALSKNQAALDSKPGQILVGSLAAAGEVAANLPGPAGLVLVDAPAVFNRYQNDGPLGAWAEGSGIVAVEAASYAGHLVGGPPGGIIAAGGAQAIVDVGQLYIAPKAGEILYQKFPGTFTPAATATVNFPGTASSASTSR
jgi:hypothetical protein